ncbi:protein of unknown function [Burkholderia multivorans]
MTLRGLAATGRIPGFRCDRSSVGRHHAALRLHAARAAMTSGRRLSGRLVLVRFSSEEVQQDEHHQREGECQTS